MAQKRMFTMKIVDSDAFLDMPLSTQCLYFHLNMRADDDGFVGNAKRIMRMIGASDDDMKVLLAKRFLIMFDDNVIVIKHWWLHNTLTKDRYHETAYTDEKAQLIIKENKAYSIKKAKCYQNDNKMLTETDNKMLTKCYQNDNSDLDIDIDIDKDLNLGIGLNLDKDLNSCSEQTSCSEPKDSTISLILNDSSEWTPSQSEIDEFTKLYPNVDVIAELRKMRGWCLGNPKRRKTRYGIKRFVTSWLGKEQDKPSIQKTVKKEKTDWSGQYTDEEYMQGMSDLETVGY